MGIYGGIGSAWVNAENTVKNKKMAYVYDFVDDVGKLDRFLKERKKIYKKERYDVREW
mgnify:CR=1 FL=1